MHEQIWQMSLPTRRIKFNTVQLADQFGLSHDRLKRWTARLKRQGRIRVVGRGRRQVPTFLVSDPATFRKHGDRGRVSGWG